MPLWELSQVMCAASICGFGQMSNPLMTVIKKCFPKSSHLRERRNERQDHV
jgi:hypothetical protein